MAKVAELAGGELALWVARANGWRIERESGVFICYGGQGDVYSFSQHGYRPDLDDAQAGPIIDRVMIATASPRGAEWEAYIFMRGAGKYVVATGETRRIAAMRAYVTSVYGDTVPDEVAA